MTTHDPSLHRPFDALLIANRGEIACRIARTARAMGLRTIALFSDADAHAPHVLACDEAIHIGSSPASESYLDIAKILAAAARCGAQAIHPGYGFLSERAHFARAVHDAGLVFVGPSADSIEAMGDKARAKRLMEEAGVPCVPGYHGEDQSEERFTSEADRIGYPIMIKAAAGGGGRGMRVVHTPDQLAPMLKQAESEAVNSCGDGTLLLEKYVAHGRHIEVQIFADSFGEVVHLGERDCSIQRRHQKVIEEAPSPFVDDALREALGAAAIDAARAVEYVGAGTVEFLVAEDRAFYFLEMNTRLQVEHPVTECVTGLDLVELQLRVAMGEEMGLEPSDLVMKGAAIEVRLYAEDCEAGFLPQTGQFLAWSPPTLQGVRVDAGGGDRLSDHSALRSDDRKDRNPWVNT